MIENFENFGIGDESETEDEEIIDEFGEVDPDSETDDDDGIDNDSFDDQDDL